METVQLATRIEKSQDQAFRQTTRELGTTPADAIRVFVAAFNRRRGFPFDVRLGAEVEPFATEEGALDFVDRQAMELLRETR
ncbi:MAG: translation repressor RelB [Bifidobacteriaceae bacterium]|jgi:DNA-damage-inducible protein J|nr:translation repressor RelB [Bifidobacteriaceae bacterium]